MRDKARSGRATAERDAKVARQTRAPEIQPDRASLNPMSTRISRARDKPEQMRPETAFDGRQRGGRRLRETLKRQKRRERDDGEEKGATRPAIVLSASISRRLLPSELSESTRSNRTDLLHSNRSSVLLCMCNNEYKCTFGIPMHGTCAPDTTSPITVPISMHDRYLSRSISDSLQPRAQRCTQFCQPTISLQNTLFANRFVVLHISTYIGQRPRLPRDKIAIAKVLKSACLPRYASADMDAQVQD